MSFIIRLRPAHLPDSVDTPKCWLTLPCADREDIERLAEELGMETLPRDSLHINAVHPRDYHPLATLGNRFELRELNLLARLMEDMEPGVLHAYLSRAHQMDGNVGRMIDEAWEAAAGAPAPAAPYTPQLLERYLTDYATGRGPDQGPAMAQL